MLSIEDCPNVELARDRIQAAALRRGLGPDVAVRVLTAADEPAVLGFTGSPTILVNGQNPFGGTPTQDLACRRYETDAGWEGAPSVEQIEAVLASESA